MLSCFNHVRFFAITWTIACQAPLSMGFSRQEYWSEKLFPSPGDLSNPGTEPMSPLSPHWQVDPLPLAPPGKPIYTYSFAVHLKHDTVNELYFHKN